MAATLRCLFACLLGLAMQLPAFAQTVPASRNEAGIIDLVEGGVTVTGPDRRGRAVRKGDALFEGDSIVTAADGELHANLTDGGVVAVRPNTQLRITRYQANGDAGDTSIFNLVKGSFRSITGWIARTNPAGYQIRTTTSTIGVRGTDHEPAHYPPPAPGERLEHEPGTYDKVNDGESFIRHPKGEVALKPGQHAFVHHNSLAAPRLLARAPAFYDRHADIDKRAAARRDDLHRKFEEQHQRLLQERQTKLAPRKDAPEQKRNLNEKKQDEKQQHRRELIEQRQHERQSQQEHRKQERAQKHDSKKDHDDDKKEHWRHR